MLGLDSEPARDIVPDRDDIQAVASAVGVESVVAADHGSKVGKRLTPVEQIDIGERIRARMTDYHRGRRPPQS